MGRDLADAPGGGAPAGGPGSATAGAGVPGGNTWGSGHEGGSIAAPTIYDVARMAGVSIASVSRVLNGQRNPREETRERVLHAVAELGFAPDGAARALSARFKEVVGVIVRRPWRVDTNEDLFSAEAESLQYPDLINRGIEAAAQRRGFDLLIRSVGIAEHDAGGRMQSLARHLLRDHGYPTLAYLGGYADSPDSIERSEVLAAEAASVGATLEFGPEWQGYYFASGGAHVINRLLPARRELPRAIACANDLTALGVMSALREHGISVPGQVAVTGFDDIPLARHLHTTLTTIRQPIREMGRTAFEVLYSMIRGERSPERDIVLASELVRRESCGCPAGTGNDGEVWL